MNNNSSYASHKKTSQSPNSNYINMSEASSIFVHAIPETGRLLPSASRWNSIEVEFGSIFPSSKPHDDTISKYSKSYSFRLAIADRSRFKRFVFINIASVLLIIVAVLLFVFLHHKHHDRGPSSNLPLVLEHTLSFFDAQKSGILPRNNPVKFRGDSGLNDVDIKRNNASLVGGFYDSGSNIKFSFTTAYTVTLLSWSVAEYHEKYSAMGQLDHVKDIIKWGSDYLLKLFVPGDSEDEGLIYSQVGSTDTSTNPNNDITCWQRPEDMTYSRPISTCTTSASDLAGEITAALSAASLIFIENKAYSNRLVQTAQKLFNSAKNNKNQGTYSSNKECGDASRDFYKSTSFLDELAWGSTWLFFATGDFSHLQYATETFQLALNDTVSDNRVFDWNNKIAANAILLTRLRYLHDPGYPYEDTLKHCSEMIDAIMCSYLSPPKWMGWVKTVTPGGLILPSPFNISSSLQFASTASFLSKLYSDYLNILQVPARSCSANSFSPQALKNFADSQINYILGKNPMKMSYVVGFGDRYPKQVHHRAASIPWDGKHYNCSEGEKWRLSKDPNPNTLLGAMVAGPSYDDKFTDQRDQPKFTEPTIARNAGLVAALAALVDPSFLGMSKFNGGIDQDRIFAKIT
ncbi:uncharacterized protein A4U43_C09F2720 [Asparagus officinalis]|uniref:Endoglucanase n=1 Tax=Asparagus officinalis TaxID=4686 RepID=A0A5P1E846_ASPOF|nr:endoglucanase 25-like isoform X2 [Asparagus officinalis]ONK57655.1 uncharacterized protein A4U43_C09F2720 [Asparagus officinalis]